MCDLRWDTIWDMGWDTDVMWDVMPCGKWGGMPLGGMS